MGTKPPLATQALKEGKKTLVWCIGIMLRFDSVLAKLLTNTLKIRGEGDKRLLKIRKGYVTT